MGIEYESTRRSGKYPYVTILRNGKPLDSQVYGDQYYYVRDIQKPTPILGSQFRKHILLEPDIGAAVGIFTQEGWVVWTFDSGEHSWITNPNEKQVFDFGFFKNRESGVAVSIMNPFCDSNRIRELVNFFKDSGIPVATRLLIIEAIDENSKGEIQFDDSMASFLKIIN